MGSTRDISYAESVFIQKILQENKDDAVWVEYVRQKDKKGSEDRILILGAFRIYVVKQGGKLFKAGHYLDVTGISSTKADEVTVTCKGWDGTFVTEKADDLINTIRSRIVTCFPGMPENHPSRPKVNVTPASRLEPVAVERGPCDSFALAYAAISAWMGITARDDIIWDINNLLSVNQIRDFAFGEFEDVKDYRALMAALSFNNHFKSLRAINVSLEKKVLAEQISDALVHNSTIEEVAMVNVNAPKGEFEVLFGALLKNKNSAVVKLDVSGNPLDDKSLAALAFLIGNLPRGLEEFQMAKCNGKQKTMQSVMAALKKNSYLPTTLSVLVVNENELGDSGSNALAAFLALPNNLKALNLANTSLKLEPVASALARGCAHLSSLDISGNKITPADVSALARALQSSESLNKINMSNTKCPVAGLREILTSLAGNVVLNDIRLEMAQNALGEEGAKMLGEVVPGARNVAYLDVSDNDFGDEGVERFVNALTKSTTLKTLVCDCNFKSKASKTRRRTMDAICELLESSCPLTSLSVAGDGSKKSLGADVSVMLDALGANKSLTKLNVAGNQMGDKGAYGLSKALQLNDCLTSLAWDNNGTTLAGLLAFKTGLARNHTLKQMEIPLMDINAATKSNLARVQKLVEEINGYLIRNQRPRRLQGQTGTGGSVIHVLNAAHRDEFSKLVMRIRAHAPEEVLKSYQPLIKDVEGHDTVVNDMQQAAEGMRAATDDEISARLKSMASELHGFLKKQSDALADDLIKKFSAGFSSVPSESLTRLRSTLEYEGETSLDSIEEITRALQSNVRQFSDVAYASMMETMATYGYERLREQLEDALEAADHARVEAEEQKAPTKKEKPAVPDKKKKRQEAVQRTTDSSKPRPMSVVNIDAVFKQEKPLNQLTKNRVAGPKGGRRPPTRRPRNADGS